MQVEVRAQLHQIGLGDQFAFRFADPLQDRLRLGALHSRLPNAVVSPGNDVGKCPTAVQGYRTATQGVTGGQARLMGQYTGVASHRGSAREFPSRETDSGANPPPWSTVRASPMGPNSNSVPSGRREIRAERIATTPRRNSDCVGRHEGTLDVPGARK